MKLLDFISPDFLSLIVFISSETIPLLLILTTIISLNMTDPYVPILILSYLLNILFLLNIFLNLYIAKVNNYSNIAKNVPLVILLFIMGNITLIILSTAPEILTELNKDLSIANTVSLLTFIYIIPLIFIFLIMSNSKILKFSESDI